MKKVNLIKVLEFAKMVLSALLGVLGANAIS